MYYIIVFQEKPKVYLTPEQLYDTVYPVGTPTLFALDIQHLLLYAVQGNVAMYKPRYVEIWTQVFFLSPLIACSDLCTRLEITGFLDVRDTQKR